MRIRTNTYPELSIDVRGGNALPYLYPAQERTELLPVYASRDILMKCTNLLGMLLETGDFQHASCHAVMDERLAPEDRDEQ